MFLPNQAPPVIRTRSTGESVRSAHGIRPRPRLPLDRKKFKLKCDPYDVEYVLPDGTTGTATEYLLAYNVAGSGVQHTEYPCSPSP